MDKDNTSRKLNALVAYPYMTGPMVQLINENIGDIRFLLDSGAFTAWKAGKPIALDDYCRFIESLPFAPWRYFTLDVIGDPHGTMKNYETMLKRGFNPIPVFTRGEDLSVLEDFYKTSDVVGIGGLVGTTKNKGFVNGIMKHVAGRRVHWLGFTQLEYIKHYRPYMCDSSSWSSGARYGAFNLYLGRGKTKMMKRADFARPPSPDIDKAIKSYGLNTHDFAVNANWHGSYSHNRVINGYSIVRMSLDIQKNLDTLMFIALTVTRELRILMNGYKIETGQEAEKLV